MSRLLLAAQAWSGDVTQAEDYVAEALARLYVCFGKELPPERACLSWLYKTIRNLVTIAWRHQQVERRHQHSLPSLDTMAALHGAEMVNGEVLPHGVGAKDIDDGCWRLALRQLSPSQTEAFLLWAEGLPSEAIGRRLGIKPGAARKRVYGARRKLIAYFHSIQSAPTRPREL